jgi:hypothetical protein
MAKDEAFAALRRVEAERDAALTAAQVSRMELATERVGREKIELELRKALDARQAAEDRQLIPRRPRGRPPKIVVETFGPIEPPRKRGRPRKIVVEGLEPIATPKKRGRPRKVQVEPMTPPRPRGRPRKVKPVEQAELGLMADNTPRRVGRPPKVREPKPVKWWTSGWKAKSP